MIQNSDKIFKITSLAFLIFLIISVIFYFSESNGKVNWLSFSTALDSAQSNDKPILLYTYSGYTSKNKIANKSIFSNDSVVSFIKNNFIPAKINIDNENERLELKKRFKIESSNFSIVLDKFGRGINFLDNSWSGSIYLNFAKEILKHPFLELDNLQNSLKSAQNSNKNILIYVSNNYIQNVDFNNILKKDALQDYFKKYFFVTCLMSYEAVDREILKNYYHSDDPILKYNAENIKLNPMENNVIPSGEIIIINNKNVLLKRINIKETKDSLKTKIEKFINK